MLSFLGVLLAALIAAMLAPYFSLFLSKEKVKHDEALKHLEEAYLLTNRIDPYTRQTINSMLFSIAALKNQIAFEKIPKTQDEPFSRLYTLFDFYLDAPSELKESINELNQKIMSSFRPIAEAINTQNIVEKDKLCVKAVHECLDAAEQAFPVAAKVLAWIKNEKNKIKSKTTIFEKQYWKNKISKHIRKCGQ